MPDKTSEYQHSAEKAVKQAAADSQHFKDALNILKETFDEVGLFFGYDLHQGWYHALGGGPTLVLHSTFATALTEALRIYRERLIAQAKAPVAMDDDNAKDLNTFMNGGR